MKASHSSVIDPKGSKLPSIVKPIDHYQKQNSNLRSSLQQTKLSTVACINNQPNLAADQNINPNINSNKQLKPTTSGSSFLNLRQVKTRSLKTAAGINTNKQNQDPVRNGYQNQQVQVDQQYRTGRSLQMQSQSLSRKNNLNKKNKEDLIASNYHAESYYQNIETNFKRGQQIEQNGQDLISKHSKSIASKSVVEPLTASNEPNFDQYDTEAKQECNQMIIGMFKEFRSWQDAFKSNANLPIAENIIKPIKQVAQKGNHKSVIDSTEQDQYDLDPNYVENLIKYGKPKPSSKTKKQGKSSERFKDSGSLTAQMHRTNNPRNRIDTGQKRSKESGSNDQNFRNQSLDCRQTCEFIQNQKTRRNTNHQRNFINFKNCSQSTSRRVNDIIMQNNFKIRSEAKLDQDNNSSCDEKSHGLPAANHQVQEPNEQTLNITNLSRAKPKKPPIVPSKPLADTSIKIQKQNTKNNNKADLNISTESDNINLIQKIDKLSYSLKQNSTKAQFIDNNGINHSSSKRSFVEVSSQHLLDDQTKSCASISLPKVNTKYDRYHQNLNCGPQVKDKTNRSKVIDQAQSLENSILKCDQDSDKNDLSDGHKPNKLIADTSVNHQTVPNQETTFQRSLSLKSTNYDRYQQNYHTMQNQNRRQSDKNSNKDKQNIEDKIQNNQDIQESKNQQNQPKQQQINSNYQTKNRREQPNLVISEINFSSQNNVINTQKYHSAFRSSNQNSHVNMQISNNLIGVHHERLIEPKLQNQVRVNSHTKEIIENGQIPFSEYVKVSQQEQILNDQQTNKIIQSSAMPQSPHPGKQLMTQASKSIKTTSLARAIMPIHPSLKSQNQCDQGVLNDNDSDPNNYMHANHAIINDHFEVMKYGRHAKFKNKTQMKIHTGKTITGSDRHGLSTNQNIETEECYTTVNGSDEKDKLTAQHGYNDQQLQLSPIVTYSYGVTQFGQLGLGFTNQKLTQCPKPIDLDIQIEHVSLGAGHALALSNTGKVYSWGLNLLGQLGLGDTLPRWSPTLVQGLKDTIIENISSGAGHNFAYNQTTNKIYSWGASADFQTGIHVTAQGEPGEDTKQYLQTPQSLTIYDKAMYKVKSISCGMKHTAIVLSQQIASSDTKNKLICFGGNQFGQCANGEYGTTKHGIEPNQTILGKIKSNFDFVQGALKDKEIADVQCGGAHTIVATKTNEVYSFGLNDKGQLGIGAVGTFCATPRKVEVFSKSAIKQIACSEESTGLVNMSGELFVWGRNTEGIFDSESGIFALDQSLEKPTLLKGFDVNKISLGSKSLIIQHKQQMEISIHGALIPSEIQEATNIYKTENSNTNKEKTITSCEQIHQDQIANQNTQSKVDSAVSNTFQTLPRVKQFFKDKIIKDFICGREMMVVLAQDIPQRTEPIEYLNFQPELSSSSSLKTEESESTISEVFLEQTPEHHASIEELSVKNESPQKISAPKEQSPPKQNVKNPSPRATRLEKIKEMLKNRPKVIRPVPKPKPKPIVQKIESPIKIPTPIKAEPDPKQVEKIKQLEQDFDRLEIEREQKRKQRQERLKIQEQIRAKMRQQLRDQLQDKREDLKKETMKLQIELECIKNQNRQITNQDNYCSDSSQSPQAPKMKRIGGGYVPPRQPSQNQQTAINSSSVSRLQRANTKNDKQNKDPTQNDAQKINSNPNQSTQAYSKKPQRSRTKNNN